MKYQTQEGDMLDRVCFRYYRQECYVEAVLDANPNLSFYTVILPSGVVIELPEFANPQKKLIQLWD